jgi:hypothetical protein
MVLKFSVNIKQLKSLGLVSLGLLLCQSLPSYGAQQVVHTVPEVRGTVKLLRGKQRPQPVWVGMSLRSTDRLQLVRGSSVRVRCHNRSKLQLQVPGTFSVAQGCKDNGKVPPSRSTRSPTRGADDPKRPYLLSPRETKIVESQPLLSWNPVAGMLRYRVEVSGLGWTWTKEVSQPEVRYSGTEALQPGMRYRVKIQGSKEGLFSNDPIVGFSLLDRETVAQVNAELAALQQEPLGAEAMVLELAQVEQSYELYGAAIARLNQWPAQDNQSAAVEKLLGDLYWQVGLPRLAQHHYTRAQALMKRDRNSLGLAEVLSRLAELEREVGELKKAIAWLEAAKPIYQALGDREQVKAIEVTLTDLRQRV